MPPRYTEIKLQDMIKVIEPQGFEFYNDPKSHEYVFQKYITRNSILYTLKLYTSISRYNDDSRDIGEDAIRLVIIGNGKHYGEGRVNRTQNWKLNLQKRINTWDQLFKVCPQCGNALKERNGKYGSFWGCITFPLCGYTEKGVNNEPRK